jgi:hypothetical protein
MKLGSGTLLENATDCSGRRIKGSVPFSMALNTVVHVWLELRSP